MKWHKSSLKILIILKTTSLSNDLGLSNNALDNRFGIN